MPHHNFQPLVHSRKEGHCGGGAYVDGVLLSIYYLPNTNLYALLTLAS